MAEELPPVYRVCRLIATKAFKDVGYRVPLSGLKKLSEVIGNDCDLQDVVFVVNGHRCAITFIDSSGAEPTYNCVKRGDGRIMVPLKIVFYSFDLYPHT